MRNKYFLTFFLSIFFLSCVPVEESETDESEDDAKTETEIYQVLLCTMKGVYGENPVSLKRTRTLSFIANQLEEGLKEYGLTTNIEKAHYIAQLTHESDGFSATVERVLGPTWRELFSGSNTKWNCRDYLDAVNEDDDYFNNRYVYSRNSYKSKFRGRGLIQLTGCFNYLGYFYHRSAKLNGNPKQTQHRTYFTFTNNSGKTEQVGMFCSEDTLEKMENLFLSEQLSLDPQDLVFDFEDSVDQLSLPCMGEGLSDFKSEEYIVDSSLWFWKKCQNSTFTKTFLNSSSDEAVSRMTQCVHGRHKTYENHASINCSNPGSDFREKSFCDRKKAFQVALSCM